MKDKKYKLKPLPYDQIVPYFEQILRNHIDLIAVPILKAYIDTKTDEMKQFLRSKENLWDPIKNTIRHPDLQNIIRESVISDVELVIDDRIEQWQRHFNTVEKESLKKKKKKVTSRGKKHEKSRRY